MPFGSPSVPFKRVAAGQRKRCSVFGPRRRFSVVCAIGPNIYGPQRMWMVTNVCWDVSRRFDRRKQRMICQKYRFKRDTTCAWQRQKNGVVEARRTPTRWKTIFRDWKRENRRNARKLQAMSQKSPTSVRTEVEHSKGATAKVSAVFISLRECTEKERHLRDMTVQESKTRAIISLPEPMSCCRSNVGRAIYNVE